MRPFTIGLISDTHGLLRAEALEALSGCDRIIHAGDIGSPDILAGLNRLAPVTAIRGNVDTGAWAASLPETAVLECAGLSLYILHDLKTLAVKPCAAGFTAVISGHSHKPGTFEKDGVLFVNPGSAGPRRFNLPVAVGRLTVTQGRAAAALIVLDCPRR